MKGPLSPNRPVDIPTTRGVLQLELTKKTDKGRSGDQGERSREGSEFSNPVEAFSRENRVHAVRSMVTETVHLGHHCTFLMGIPDFPAFLSLLGWTA